MKRNMESTKFFHRSRLLFKNHSYGITGEEKVNYPI